MGRGRCLGLTCDSLLSEEPERMGGSDGLDLELLLPAGVILRVVGSMVNGRIGVWTLLSSVYPKSSYSDRIVSAADTQNLKVDS